MRYRDFFAVVAGVVLLVWALAGCNGSDCPLGNVVRMHALVYDSETGETTSIADTLTVTALPLDTVLLSGSVETSTLSLPLSNTEETDVLLLTWTTSAGEVTDTLRVTKTNQAHFENLDCSASVFHELTSVSISERTPTVDFPTAIDSVVITDPEVNYDTGENIRFYITTLS